jgi:hypothetical protein
MEQNTDVCAISGVVETLLKARIVHAFQSSAARDYGSIETTVTYLGSTVSESLPS